MRTCFIIYFYDIYLNLLPFLIVLEDNEWDNYIHIANIYTIKLQPPRSLSLAHTQAPKQKKTVYTQKNNSLSHISHLILSKRNKRIPQEIHDIDIIELIKQCFLMKFVVQQNLCIIEILEWYIPLLLYQKNPIFLHYKFGDTFIIANHIDDYNSSKSYRGVSIYSASQDVWATSSKYTKGRYLAPFSLHSLRILLHNYRQHDIKKESYRFRRTLFTTHRYAERHLFIFL